MNNILVMTHGGMAEGVLDSLTMITGEHDGVVSLSFRPDWSLDTLVAAIHEKVDELSRQFGDQPTLVLVDLFGGTPSNAIAMLLAEGCDLYVIGGVNLPMILEAVLSREEAQDMDVYCAQVLEAGREGMVDIRKMLLED